MNNLYLISIELLNQNNYARVGGVHNQINLESESVILHPRDLHLHSLIKGSENDFCAFS